ncbi:polysaccharide pyruvyl transferase family protein [Sutcliffiella sp. NPDC057660]|uniref:polysaccharide pyruvyl transferase family protein n=1 Tax=Sutcliffiella sp. NPDC057660 TaxID=3346199 RepID=UPI0036D0DBBA
MKKVLYLGWLGHTNLGDELMWDVFREKFFKLANTKKYELYSSDRQRLFKLKKKRHLLKHFDVIVLGGGSLLTPSYINILYNAINVNKNVEIIIWGSGIDWIEKEQLNLINPKIGFNSRRNNKEFNIFPNRLFISKLQKVINHSKYVALRGPYTFQALKLMGVNLDKVIISGDPGILVKGNFANNTSGEKIVAINWGTAKNKIYGKNELYIEEELVKVAKKLIGLGYQICIFPVMDHDIYPCKQLYQKINDQVNVRVITKLNNQYETAKLFSTCNFSINFKLHANVLSAVAEIPFISLGYRFKSFDFSKSVDLENLVVATDDSNLSEKILEASNYIVEHHNKPHNLMKNMQKHKIETNIKLNKAFSLFK